jgi:hypothetical protein
MNNRNVKVPCFLALVLLAAGVGLATAARRNESESEEARAIKAQYARQVERIKSLEVAYKRETKSNLSPEKLRAMPEHMNQLFLPLDEWHEAFKGQKRYGQQIQPEPINYLAPLDANGLFAPPEPPADAPPVIKENQKQLKEQYARAIANMKAQEARGVHPAKRDPAKRDLSKQNVTRAFNGKTLWMKQPTSKHGDRFTVWPNASKADWFQVSPYLSSVGLHVPDPSGREMVRQAQAMFQVAEWIEDRSYDLEMKTEVVDGSTCVILKGSLNSLLQPGFLAGNLTDRIWLDRDHGLVLRRREMARDGTVTMRWENSHLKEVEPGMWLPMSTRQEQFPVRPVLELNGKPVLIEEIQVKSLTVNKVPDDLFDMTPKTGDAIEDLRGRF